MAKKDYMELALQIVAQCWGTEENKNKVMDADLSDACAYKLAYWIDKVAQNQRNAEYYKSLLDRIGKAIGERAYTPDYGSMSIEVLYDKLPEIIENDYKKEVLR